jgi:rhamnosyltransferase
MLGFVALTLIGAQVIQLGVSSPAPTPAHGSVSRIHSSIDPDDDFGSGMGSSSAGELFFSRSSVLTDEEVEVVVVDSGSREGSHDSASGFGARVYSIPSAEINHGRTRDLAAEPAPRDVLVFTTQDAYAADERWLATLVGPLRSDSVAGTYGSQLPHASARPSERYFLDVPYGPTARAQRIESEEDLTFEATRFSNVNSAIPRKIWEEYRFADDIVMSEDREWLRRALTASMTIAYQPSAAVFHSHPYTVHGPSGASSTPLLPPNAPMSGRQPHVFCLAPSGRGAIRPRVTWLWRTGHRRWLPYAAVYELAKFASLQLGRRHRLLRGDSSAG